MSTAGHLPKTKFAIIRGRFYTRADLSQVRMLRLRCDLDATMSCCSFHRMHTRHSKHVLFNNRASGAQFHNHYITGRIFLRCSEDTPRGAKNTCRYQLNLPINICQLYQLWLPQTWPKGSRWIGRMQSCTLDHLGLYQAPVYFDIIYGLILTNVVLQDCRWLTS
ncbi:hypothetical protein FA95DRAFT_88610 [Auriscalpium vulgare]|uniref:Uncharacterized protein n=1 Tax=Auriscalpium vulgare TaxID=40419 RepID=A0ACB8RQ67_9AGAM|nr:hypothetical protein FA95DRAFT_88610 [Auriscalpium vulgare]